MVTRNDLADPATQAKAQPLITKIIADNYPLVTYLDDSIAAVTDLVKRVRAAELLLDQIRDAWVALDPPERIEIGELAPGLAERLVRIRP